LLYTIKINNNYYSHYSKQIFINLTQCCLD